MEVIKSLDELLPVAKRACELFLLACERAGLDIFVTETFRSQARQDYLYAQGRDREGAIVTWTRNSRHTSRLAWDIAVRGENLYDKNVLTACGAIAESLGITWGGTWSTPDMPHFEVTKDWGDILETRYNTLDELPQWARADIEKFIKKGAIADAKNLDLSLDMVRVLIIVARFIGE